jgi:NDP-sugar pyrophosphorylase family protein
MKRAVILAGGLGTRLRPYTVVLPKPLMPVGPYPILEVIVRQLVGFGYDRITLAVNHQAEIIKAYFGTGEKWHISIDYSLETQPLSTIAPLKLIRDLPEHFILMNGDVLTDLDLGALLSRHSAENRLFTIAASQRRTLINYGLLEIDGQGLLCGFQEKPQLEHFVSMGLYAVSRSVLDQVPDGMKYGFDDLMREMLLREQPVHVERYEGYWLDIGRPDDYMQAIDEFEQWKGRLLPHG